jgi:hypothetical protein
VLIAGISGCGSKQARHTVSPPTITGSVRQALAGLPPAADSHQKSARIENWIRHHIQQQQFLPKADAHAVLDSGKADPMSSALLFTAMLRTLHIESRTHVVTGVPGFGWYPLVEILDADGDHLWDPFTGRYAPDYDGTPLGFSEALSAPTILGASGDAYAEGAADLHAPSFHELGSLPSFVWDAKVASPVVAKIDFESSNGFGLTSTEMRNIGARGEYWPAFAGAGVTASELGPVVLMHSYVLSGLTPDAKYQLGLTVAQGEPRRLLIMADGAQLENRIGFGNNTLLTFAAAGTQATVNIGTLGSTFIRFDAIHWSRK